MQSCNKCGIQIRGNKKCCPLCQGDLSGTPSQGAFPVLKKSRVTSLSLVKLFTFFFVAVEISFSAVHFLFDYQLGWVTFAMIICIVAWLDMIIGVYYRNNMVKNITVQVYIVMAAAFVIDRFTGFRGWSVQWVIPCSYVGLVLITVCIGKGCRLLLEEYILYLAVDMVLSLGQAVFMGLGWNRFAMPAVISMAALLILGAAALIFRFRDLKDASEKLFHL